MSLYARLTAHDATKIGVHDFGSAVHLWLLGDVNDARMVSEFSLSAGEQTELAAIKTKYDGLSTANKGGFLLKAHSVFILCEAGRMTENEAKTVLGF